ncbi:MAG: hypothetical protein R3E91_04670 [Chlamydiales bacterium]
MSFIQSSAPPSYRVQDPLPQKSSKMPLKGFIIFLIFTSAISMIIGFFALMASKGLMQTALGLNAFTHLGQIGLLNSSLMLSGSTILFIMSLSGWGYLHHKIRES